MGIPRPRGLARDLAPRGAPAPETPGGPATGVGPGAPGSAGLPAVRLLRDPNYRLFLAASGTWYLGQWTWLLVSGWLVLQLTNSVFMTQLVGVATLAPMLVGGLLSGVVADALDRRRLLIFNYLASLALLLLATALVLPGWMAGWHVLALGVVFGAVQTLDAACHRTFAFDIVGRDLVPYALALESMTLTGAMIAGPLLAGALLDVLPLAGTSVAAGPYLLVAALLALGALLVARIRPPVRQVLIRLRPGSILVSTAEGLRAVAGSRALIGVLGITVVVNVTFFSFMPLIPVFAGRVLHVNATLMGLLSAAQGIGSFLGSAVIASRRNIQRKSIYYVGGSLIALASLLLFAISPVYALAVAALVVAGIGVSGFAAMQATLILSSTSEQLRGRAMGILNMAIGMLPVGMFVLGVLAETLGPSVAVALTAVAGFGMILLWTAWMRELREL